MIESRKEFKHFKGPSPLGIKYNILLLMFNNSKYYLSTAFQKGPLLPLLLGRHVIWSPPHLFRSSLEQGQEQRVVCSAKYNDGRQELRANVSLYAPHRPGVFSFT